MKPVLNFINRWVREAESYSDKHLEFAWQHPEIVRMMSNENPLPPSDEVIKAIIETASQINLYPNTGPVLRKKLGEKNGLGSDNVILGNGSTDIINIIINTFVAPGDEVIISIPTFSMYETRTRVNGGVPVLIPMTSDFYWDIDKIIHSITPKTKLIFICSPNNPTGNQIVQKDLLRILSEGIPTFLDEAYYELEENAQTLAFLINQYPNLMINRTFSKAYGLAGLRIGYALADKEIISYLNRMKIPWNVSLIALNAALVAVEIKEEQGRKRQNCLDGRSYILNEINEIPGLKAYPSEGNFILIDAGALKKGSKEIMDDMLSRGIFIRPIANEQLRPGYVRVTIGTPEQNQHFINTFKQYVFENMKGK